MAKVKRVVISTGNLVRSFSRYSDMAQTKPVLVTKRGRPHNVLLSFAEYERLKGRDQQAFMAEDTPAEFLAQLEALAYGKTR